MTPEKAAYIESRLMGFNTLACFVISERNRTFQFKSFYQITPKSNPLRLLCPVLRVLLPESLPDFRQAKAHYSIGDDEFKIWLWGTGLISLLDQTQSQAFASNFSCKTTQLFKQFWSGHKEETVWVELAILVSRCSDRTI